jgi:hypothetical protein
MTATKSHSFRRWLAARPFLRVYLVRSLLLWCGFKTATLVLLSMAKVPDPLAFHALPEMACFVMAWLWLGSVMRRNGEDILLKNLGLPVQFLFLVLALVFAPLSLLLSLAA